ncbi:XOO1806 family protein [Marilutibacter alkalisoli]|uniref:Secreted protein n=1 Tax=Marilutibacter alkalisoli TaxID=2591633 RepID=A0A514BPI5_9GAMM|nr:hypothetical protein [Lysobacter alkalisoli]QDH69292.1 hypothetical protein FKV23_03655 [Lysobacter alkalisoli]
MRTHLLQLPLALLLALGVAAGARAQGDSRTPPATDSTVLPIWNNASGKLEAVLLLEPTGSRATSSPAVGTRWRFGANNTLDTTFSASSGNTLGLVCNRATGLANAIGNLANHCLLASLERDAGSSGSREVTAGASVGNSSGRIGLLVGEGRDTLPGWMSPNSRNSRFDENTLTVYGQKNIGREATVSIGGTWARARLIPADDLPAGFSDRWDTTSLTIGAEVGNFGANIVGRVVDTPNQPGQWEALGVGLTWRTPWSGQLTVGAENVVTRGKNPFAPDSATKDEGTIPYVRYEQDL